MRTMELWWLALAIAAVVIVVVAVLLSMIIVAAKSIDRNAQEIWTVGKQIAGNTVSIWMLEKTNDRVEAMLDSAQAIEKNTAAMDEQLSVVVRTVGGTQP
jgi:hypothetical protein